MLYHWGYAYEFGGEGHIVHMTNFILACSRVLQPAHECSFLPRLWSTKMAGALLFLFQCLKQPLTHFPSFPSSVLWCQGLNVISLNSESDVGEARRSRRNAAGCNEHEPNMPRLSGPSHSSEIGRAKKVSWKWYYVAEKGWVTEEDRDGLS